MSITSGIGLVSGIDTVSLIEQLLAIDSQAKVPIFQRISSLTAAKTALLDVNARMLSLGNTSRSFRMDEVFRSGSTRRPDKAHWMSSSPSCMPYISLSGDHGKVWPFNVLGWGGAWAHPSPWCSVTGTARPGYGPWLAARGNASTRGGIVRSMDVPVTFE